MIVLDSSALLAIFFVEPEKDAFESAILANSECVMSAVNAHETIVVLRARVGAAIVTDFWSFVARAEIEIVPFDRDQVVVATLAFEKFGKGMHSKARLNLCDCAAYALAKTRNVPLLFKGDDFPQTDVVAAV